MDFGIETMLGPRWSRSLVFAGLVVVAFAGCEDPRACERDEECARDEVCREGTCWPNEGEEDEDGSDQPVDADGSGSDDGDVARDGPDRAGEVGDGGQPGGDGEGDVRGGDGSEGDGVSDSRDGGKDAPSGPCSGSLRSCPTNPECEDELSAKSESIGCLDGEEVGEVDFPPQCFCIAEPAEQFEVNFDIPANDTSCSWRESEVRIDVVVDVQGCSAEEFEQLRLDAFTVNETDCPTDPPAPGAERDGWCERLPEEGKLLVHMWPDGDGMLPFKFRKSDYDMGFAYDVTAKIVPRD